MNEYSQIKFLLEKVFYDAGAQKVEENIQSNFSRYTQFTLDALMYRLVWSVQDNCGYIQIFERDCWYCINIFVPENSDSDFNSSLVRLRVALIEHIALVKLGKWNSFS